MNDITIKAKTIKLELFIFVGLFIISFGLNIYSILHYKTSWAELYTHIHIVALIAIASYGILAVVRLLIRVLTKLFRKKATA